MVIVFMKGFNMYTVPIPMQIFNGVRQFGELNK